MPPPALVLNGSPSRDGNTMRLADAVLDAAGRDRRVEHLFSLNIAPCRACGACRRGHPCPWKDDFPALARRIARADTLLIASPLHFTSLTAPLVACISRLHPHWLAGGRERTEPDKAGALVLTAGSDYPRMFEPARAVAAAAFRTLSIPFVGMATAKNTDRVAVADNADALNEAAVLGGLLRG